MIVLDTHALLWWALDPDKLSPTAAQVCAQMERDGGFASAISVWELGVKIRNGKLQLGISLPEFVRLIERSGAVELLPVDTAIWLRTVELDWAHRNPADRVIAATALDKGLPLLSKDAAFQSFAAIRCVW